MLACMWNAIKQDDTDDTDDTMVVEETELETGGEEQEDNRVLRAQKEDKRVSRGQIKILKICVTAWRFQHMDSIALTYEEFEYGMKRLDYVPPIIVSKTDWNDHVVRYKKLSVPAISFHVTRLEFRVSSHLQHIHGHMTFFEIPQVCKV